MLNESFAFVAAQGMFGFGEGDQGASMAGSKYTSWHLKNRCGIWKTMLRYSASKERMHAYLLAGILRMPGKMHGNDTG